MTKNIAHFSSENGFTVLEMLVAFAITLIVVSTALPRVQALLAVMNRSNAEVQIMQHIRWLQAKSVEEGCHGIFQISSDNKSYSLGCDYVTYSTSATPAADTVFESYYLPNEITITSDASIIFNTRGQIIDYEGNLNTRTISMYHRGTLFQTGTIRATGFFELDD